MGHAAGLETLARHFTEAGIPERAIEYWTKAGRQAMARSTMREAETLLRRGLRLVDSLADTVRRRELELDLLIALGRTLSATMGAGIPEVGEVHARAHHLCDRLGYATRLLPILLGEWAHYQLRANLGRARQLAADVRQIGETLDDNIARVSGYRTSGFVCLFSGDLPGAVTYLNRGLAIYNPSAAAVIRTIRTIQLLGPLSWATVILGYPDRGRSLCAPVLAEARELGHSYVLVSTLWWIWGGSWLARSQPQDMWRQAEELLAIASESNFPYYRALGLAACGWYRAASGDAGQGVLMLHDSFTGHRNTNCVHFKSGIAAMLADAHRIAGQPQEGLLALSEAERRIEATGEHVLEAETLRLRANLLMLTGNLVGAEECARKAIAVAQHQQAKLFELRASVSLARLWRDRGKPQEVLHLLAPIHDWFTEGFDLADLQEAKALLDELRP